MILIMMMAVKAAAALLACPPVVGWGFAGRGISQNAIHSFGTVSRSSQSSATAIFATPSTDEETKIMESTSLEQSSIEAFDAEKATTSEGLPWWWDMVWKLDVMKLGEDGEDVIFGDSANVLRTNIEQIYGGFPSLDGCPLAEGDISDIADGTMFIGLQRYFNNYGSPYKLCFGPKSFLVISDPVQAKHVLRDANVNYDKVGSILQFRVLTSMQVQQTHPAGTRLFLSLLSLGHLGGNPGTHHGKRLDSGRPGNMVRPKETNCASLSQGLVESHDRPLCTL